MPHLMKDLIVPIISAAIEKAHTAGKLKSSASSVTVGTEAPKDPSPESSNLVRMPLACGSQR